MATKRAILQCTFWDMACEKSLCLIKDGTLMAYIMLCLSTTTFQMEYIESVGQLISKGCCGVLAGLTT